MPTIAAWPVVALMAATSLPAALSAQQGRELADRCAAAGGDPATCALAAGAGRDLIADVGLLAGPGSEVSGQTSTLGRRVGGSPRFAPFFRVGGHSVAVADLGTAGGGSGERSPFVTGLHAGLGLGLFDGLTLLPNVGGVLSLDVVGQAAFLFFPEDEGFDGRVNVYSLGARVGLLRESFVLPGVTVSLARRLSGSLRYGDTGAGDAGQVEIDPSITSLRITAGKDLFAFGVVAGLGWDDASSSTDVQVTNGAGALSGASATLTGTRSLYFLGLSRQLGVLAWISAEVGWANGFDPVAGGGVSSPDRDTTVFGSVALVFKL